jgi:hypothetical protein
MAKRSPNYPSLTLEQAYTKARKVYDQEHTHAAPREVVAAALGYTGLNGAALSTIAAIAAYGLLEKAGTGSLKVAPDAVSIFELDEGHPRRAEAINRMAFNPKLFAELKGRFGNEPPSDVNLKYYLIQEKEFLPKAAADVIRVYRANLELVTEEIEEYNGGDGQPLTEEKPPMQTSLNRSGAAQTGQPFVQPPAQGMAGTREFKFPLSFQRDVSATITLHGQLTKRDLEFLKTKVGDLIEGFEDEEPPPRQATWKNKDHDQPVTITGELGEKEGRRFFAAKETTTGIPEDELEFQDSKAKGAS